MPDKNIEPAPVLSDRRAGTTGNDPIIQNGCSQLTLCCLEKGKTRMGTRAGTPIGKSLLSAAVRNPHIRRAYFHAVDAWPATSRPGLTGLCDRRRRRELSQRIPRECARTFLDSCEPHPRCGNAAWVMIPEQIIFSLAIHAIHSRLFTGLFPKDQYPILSGFAFHA
jgi:hypothetical protein